VVPKNQSRPEAHVSIPQQGQFLRRGVVSTSTKPQAGEPALVSCMRLLIQYIRIYALYWRPFSIRNLRTRNAVVTETKLSWRHKICDIQNVVKWTKNKQINYDQDNKDHAICWMLKPAPHVYPQFVLCSQKVAPCLLLSFLVLKPTHFCFETIYVLLINVK